MILTTNQSVKVSNTISENRINANNSINKYPTVSNSNSNKKDSSSWFHALIKLLKRVNWITYSLQITLVLIIAAIKTTITKLIVIIQKSIINLRKMSTITQKGKAKGKTSQLRFCRQEVQTNFLVSRRSDLACYQNSLSTTILIVINEKSSN